MTQQQWNEKVTNTLAALKFVSGPIFQNTETSEPYISSSGLSFENSNTKSIPIHFGSSTVRASEVRETI